MAQQPPLPHAVRTLGAKGDFQTAAAPTPGPRLRTREGLDHTQPHLQDHKQPGRLRILLNTDKQGGSGDTHWQGQGLPQCHIPGSDTLQFQKAKRPELLGEALQSPFRSREMAARAAAALAWAQTQAHVPAASLTLCGASSICCLL